MRIGLLGGTFDPVHLGHLSLAEGAQRELRLDQVLWIPSNTPPHKSLPALSPAEDRASMVERAIAGHPGFYLSKVELDRAGPSYAIDTVRSLQAAFQGQAVEWYFLIGSDALEMLPCWKESQELMRRVQFAVVPRPGSGLPDPLPEGVVALGLKTPPICASQIRRRVHTGQSLRGFVPDAVAAYIQEKGLYR